MNLSWAELNAIAKLHGESFYLLDLAKFQANYQAFLAAFRDEYVNTQIAYSYKTNYTPRLCQLVQSQGGYAEVVSGMEYDLAIRLGVPPERIIFNGPYKSPADFEQALLKGSVVNLDAAYEVFQLQALAGRYPDKHLRVGIRCNFDVGNPQRSRFGFDIEDQGFLGIIQTLSSLPNCRIVGLHCHYLAPQRSAEAYALIARRMVALAITEFAGHKLEFIDLGGGFFSHMDKSLSQQFPYPIPSFAAYGQAIARVFADVFTVPDGPELILEPGLALVADVMQFITRVVDVKYVGGRQLALVVGSQYDVKPTLSVRNLPVKVVSAPAGAMATGLFDVVGTTCMEGDCLYTAYAGTLKPEDFVIFENVGAYTNVLRPPFINPAPPILSLDVLGQLELARRRETGEDVFVTYAFN